MKLSTETEDYGEEKGKRKGSIESYRRQNVQHTTNVFVYIIYKTIASCRMTIYSKNSK